MIKRYGKVGRALHARGIHSRRWCCRAISRWRWTERLPMRRRDLPTG